MAMTDRPAMSTPASLALVFTGLLLVGIGLFVAGNPAIIGLGVAALVAAGLVEAALARNRR
jgi:hypothetical protein